MVFLYIQNIDLSKNHWVFWTPVSANCKLCTLLICSHTSSKYLLQKIPIIPDDETNQDDDEDDEFSTTMELKERLFDRDEEATNDSNLVRDFLRPPVCMHIGLIRAQSLYSTIDLLADELKKAKKKKKEKNLLRHDMDLYLNHTFFQAKTYQNTKKRRKRTVEIILLYFSFLRHEHDGIFCFYDQYLRQ